MKKKLLSQYVKELREKTGLTANEFAKLHNVSHSQIAKYESGALDSPSLVVASKFCKNFNISPQEYVDMIECKNPTIIDVANFTASIEHLMGTNYELDRDKYISAFFEYAKQKNHVDKLQIFKDLDFNSMSLLVYDASMVDKNDDNIITYFIPYRKVQSDGYTFKYYGDFIQKLGLIYMQKDPLIKNYLFITPSLEAFNAFADRKYREVDDVNIIIYYYKYRREPQYKVICGNDYLK